MMTQAAPAERPRGRPRKPVEEAGPSVAKRDRGRPSLMLWEDPDRYAVAFLLALVYSLGFRNDHAAKLAALLFWGKECEPDAAAASKAAERGLTALSFAMPKTHRLDKPLRHIATRLREKAAWRRHRNLTEPEGVWLFRMTRAIGIALRPAGMLAKFAAVAEAELVGEKDFAVAVLLPMIDAALKGGDVDKS